MPGVREGDSPILFWFSGAAINAPCPWKRNLNNTTKSFSYRSSKLTMPFRIFFIVNPYAAFRAANACANKRFTTAGSALPLLACITCPMKKPRSFSLPPTYAAN